MKKLGELLKEERKKQKLELADIAEKTKVGLEKLERIERGDYEALPAKVFTRGLIKSYAKLLKLDVDSIIQIFEKEYEGLDEESLPSPTPAPSIEPQKEEEEKQAALFLFQAPKSFFLILGFAVTALLCVFIYITLQKINSYEKEEVDPSVELAELDDFSEKIDEEKPEETQEKEAPIKKDTPKNPEIKKAEAKKVPSKKVEESRTESQKSALQKIAQAEKMKVQKAAKPTPAPAPVAVTKDQSLLVEAFEPVRLEIFWSTGKPQVMLLKADETKKIIFNNKIKIHLSDGGVVNITHNGQELGVPGQIRKPIELNYP